MAVNKKISELDVATTPLDGTEQLAGTQAGATKRVPASAIVALSKDKTAITGILKGDGTNVSAAVEGTDYSYLPNVTNATQQIKHGFPSRATSSLSFNNATKIFVLDKTGADYIVYVGGVPLTITTPLTVDFTTKGSWASPLGQWFVWLKADGTLDAGKTVWSLLDETIIPVATVHWDGTTGIIGEERHSSRRNLEFHKQAHDTWGAQYVSGFSPTPTFTSANTFTFPGGSTADEDIYHTLTGAQTTCQIGYRVAGGASMTFDAPGTAYAKLSAGVPVYDAGGVLTPLPLNQYGIFWVYATNRPATAGQTAVVSIVGQGNYAAINQAQAAPLPTLSGFSVAEWKLLYRVIVRNTAGALSFNQVTPLYNVSTGPAILASAPSTVAAGNVTFTPAGGLVAANVQTALEELDTEKVPTTRTVNAKALTADITLGAGDVGFTPAGGLVATNVQTALKELDMEKLAIDAATTAKNTNYSMATADAGRVLCFTAAATLTLPAASGFPEGFQCIIWNTSASATDVTLSGTVVATGTKIAQKKSAMLLVTGGTWYAAGGL